MIPPTHRRHILALVLLLLTAVPAAAQDAVERSLVGLRSLDQRVATIGHRLAVASLDLCVEREWLPGFAVHDLSQYGPEHRPAAIRAFRLDHGPGVLALAAGGPAERAGLRPDAILVSVDGEGPPRTAAGPRASFEQAERILDVLDRAFSDGVAVIEVDRGGQRTTIPIEAERGCASRFQLVPSRTLNARADGRYVQVTTAIGQYVADDDELAAVLAHEFAHNVLRHRLRLNEAGVQRGFLSNFGRNARLIRETEAEADRLSVYLLDRAGFPPAAAVRLWARFGRRGFAFLGSPTHPNWRRRIAMIEAEIEIIQRARAEGRIPVPVS